MTTTTSAEASERTRLHLTWAVLIAATMISTWLLGKDAVGARVALVGTFALASWKVLLVMREFMELRGVTHPARFFFEAWAVLVPVTIVVLAW